MARKDYRPVSGTPRWKTICGSCSGSRCAKIWIVITIGPRAFSSTTAPRRGPWSRARATGVVAGLPGAKLALGGIRPANRLDAARRRRGRGREGDQARRNRRTGAELAHRRAAAAEFARPALRHRHADAPVCRRRRRHRRRAFTTPARPCPAGGVSRSTPCAWGAARIIASACSTASSSKTTTSPKGRSNSGIARYDAGRGRAQGEGVHRGAGRGGAAAARVLGSRCSSRSKSIA